MACKIAINKPLITLQSDLQIGERCHSYRKECIHHLNQPVTKDSMFASLGAILGYCQALFVRKGTAEEHTLRVSKLLREIGAPFYKSHELFWGNKRPEESALEFIDAATGPLLGDGRMPILITGLEPCNDVTAIRSIVSTDIKVVTNETALIRLVLDDTLDSVSALENLLRDILKDAFENKTMPRWWPLIQGDVSESIWEALRIQLGGYWKYVNVAISPFVKVPDFVKDQVTVAQIVVGAAEGISAEGIQLPLGMKILGARENDSYDIDEYFSHIKSLPVDPTLIVLGPSLPQWTDEDNQSRLAKLLPILESKCRQLWDIGSRFPEMWELAA